MYHTNSCLGDPLSLRWSDSNANIRSRSTDTDSSTTNVHSGSANTDPSTANAYADSRNSDTHRDAASTFRRLAHVSLQPGPCRLQSHRDHP